MRTIAECRKICKKYDAEIDIHDYDSPDNPPRRVWLWFLRVHGAQIGIREHEYFLTKREAANAAADWAEKWLKEKCDGCRRNYGRQTNGGQDRWGVRKMGVCT